MHYFTYLLLIVLLSLTTASCVNSSSDKAIVSTQQIVIDEPTKLVADEHHGYVHIDGLQHIEIKDENGNPSQITQAIIDRYNDSSSRFFDKHDTELAQIYDEIMTRRPRVAADMPFEVRGLTFTMDLQDGERFPVMYYSARGSTQKHILIDQAQRAEGISDYAFQNYELSPNNQFFSWIEDTENGSVTTLYITPTGKPNEILHKIVGVGRSLTWDDQSKRVYYTKLDPADGRYYQIRMFNIETKKDVEIYTEKDEKYLAFMYGSDGSNGMFIYSTNWSVSEAHYIDFDKSYVDHELVLGRDKGMTYGLGRFGKKYVISYQADQNTAKIASFKVPNADIVHWNTLYVTNSSITKYKLTKNYFVFVERSAGADKIKSLKVAEEKIEDIHITDGRYGAYFRSGKHDPDNDVVRIAYTTFLSNRTTIDFDLKQNIIKNADKPTIPGFVPDDYIIEFKYVNSHDDVQVPVTIIRRKDTELPAPTYQYVYGSYGFGMSPYMPFYEMSLIDRGFVFVVSHVRGGNELGKQWHDGGRLLNRKNSFADFEAITRYLIEKQYANKGEISIGGESAAGHILGVAVNDNPELYKSMTALVPALDIFNKLLNPSLLVTKTSWSEFGNPVESKEAYKYIRSYSALENLRPQDYPPYYITARLNDRNVDFFEPLKWAISVDKIDINPDMNMVSIENGGHVRTGYGGKEYDFAKQMLFILKTHGK